MTISDGILFQPVTDNPYLWRGYVITRHLWDFTKIMFYWLDSHNLLAMPNAKKRQKYIHSQNPRLFTCVHPFTYISFHNHINSKPQLFASVKKNWLPHIIISILTFNETLSCKHEEITKLPMHLVARHKSPTPMLGRKFSPSLMRGHWWWMWPWGLVFNGDFSGQSQLGECVCDEPLASIIDEPFTMPDYVLVMSRCEHKEWIFAFDL